MYIFIYIRVRDLGYPEWLISSLGAGACGVVGVGMFVVVSVGSVVVSVDAPPGGSPRGREPPATHPGPRGPHWLTMANNGYPWLTMVNNG